MVLALELTVKRGTRWVADCSPNEGSAWETHQLKSTVAALGACAVSRYRRYKSRCRRHTHDTVVGNNRAFGNLPDVVDWPPKGCPLSKWTARDCAAIRRERESGNCISLGDGSRASGGDAATVVHPVNLPHPSSLLLPPVVGAINLRGPRHVA